VCVCVFLFFVIIFKTNGMLSNRRVHYGNTVSNQALHALWVKKHAEKKIDHSFFEKSRKKNKQIVSVFCYYIQNQRQISNRRVLVEFPSLVLCYACTYSSVLLQATSSYNRVLRFPHALDFAFNDVAYFKENWRLLKASDAWGRTSEDHISR